MKRILFLSFLALQAPSLRAMGQPEGPMKDLPKEMLQKIAHDQIMSDISKAKTLKELDQAYQFVGRFAQTSKRHRDAADVVKKSKAVQDAYSKRKNEILGEITKTLKETYEDFNRFNISKEGIDARDGKGMTALMFAAMLGYKDLVQLLLVNGATVDARDKRGWTALMFAAIHGYKDTVKVLLVNGADATIKNKNGESAYDRAKKWKHTEMLELLVGAKNTAF